MPLSCRRAVWRDWELFKWKRSLWKPRTLQTAFVISHEAADQHGSQVIESSWLYPHQRFYIVHRTLHVIECYEEGLPVAGFTTPACESPIIPHLLHIVRHLSVAVFRTIFA